VEKSVPVPVSDPTRYKLKDLFVKIDKFKIRFLYIIHFPSLFYTESKYTDSNTITSPRIRDAVLLIWALESRSCEKVTLSRCFFFAKNAFQMFELKAVSDIGIFGPGRRPGLQKRLKRLN
jgi:hypothetical protein